MRRYSAVIIRTFTPSNSIVVETMATAAAIRDIGHDSARHLSESDMFTRNSHDSVSSAPSTRISWRRKSRYTQATSLPG